MCYLLLLALLIIDFIYISKGDINLEIVQEKDGQETSVSQLLHEKQGSNLSLICKLTTSSNESVSDDHITWGKKTSNFRFTDEEELEVLVNRSHMYEIWQNSERNKATKHFGTLSFGDGGTYFCMSWKYKRFKIIHITVDFGFIKDMRNYLDAVEKPIVYFGDRWFCNDKMFKCGGSRMCIAQHYVCDGMIDCKDGSDEFWSLCNEDPCKEKIRCDNGRCIPTEWCCDRRRDAGCTVKNRPTCCPTLTESYDEDENYLKRFEHKEKLKGNGTRYLFITICASSIFLSIVMFLLIISKVCSFRNRPPCYTSSARSLGNETRTRGHRRHRGRHNMIHRTCDHAECAVFREVSPFTSCSYQTDASTNEPSDPLVYLFSHRGGNTHLDQPPSYFDVVKDPPPANCLPVSESCFNYLAEVPPPPYADCAAEGGGNVGNQEANATSMNPNVSSC